MRACFIFLSNSDILTEISVSETSPATQFAEYQFKDDALPCPALPVQPQLDVNMINDVVDEIKYKITDILGKHKNLYWREFSW